MGSELKLARMLLDVCDEIKSSPDDLEDKLAKFLAIFKLLIENDHVDGEEIMRLSEKKIKTLEKKLKL
jgi:hypothetical protein